jgi:hypothetical protein
MERARGNRLRSSSNTAGSLMSRSANGKLCFFSNAFAVSQCEQPGPVKISIFFIGALYAEKGAGRGGPRHNDYPWAT